MKLSIITLTLAATAIAAPTTNGNDQSGCRAEEAPMCCNPSNSIGPGSGSGLLSGIGGLLGLGGLLGNPFQYVFLAADCEYLLFKSNRVGSSMANQDDLLCRHCPPHHRRCPWWSVLHTTTGVLPERGPGTLFISSIFLLRRNSTLTENIQNGLINLGCNPLKIL